LDALKTFSASPKWLTNTLAMDGPILFKKVKANWWTCDMRLDIRHKNIKILRILA
jgi:hypothetical protein